MKKPECFSLNGKIGEGGVFGVSGALCSPAFLALSPYYCVICGGNKGINSYPERESPILS